MRSLAAIILFLCFSCQGIAQLKFLVEDFEGCDKGDGDLKPNGLYTYGPLKARVTDEYCTGKAYSGRRCIQVSKQGKMEYGGWGKGISMFVVLDQNTDHLNFYLFQPGNTPTSIVIELQEDDDADNVFKKERDDTWSYTLKTSSFNKWELVSIPLRDFKDSNPGGDGGFNVNYQGGKLFGIMFSFQDGKSIKNDQQWFYDFISFSKGKLPTAGDIFQPPPGSKEDFCALGAWSGEGNNGNFADIATAFEGNFKPAGAKLGVVHFFQPFGGDKNSGLFPSAERINKVIRAGYIPLITLENHFVYASAGKQPNLYSIVEGHFDSFFGYWANQIKQVEGTVMLRMLHEFNGDWYDWCTVKNDRNPQLVAKAFRYIVNIFRENNVKNVKFMWCPNSMSVPQERWNYIMDAYPGDDYVDLVALDVYNGAGNSQAVWRSFRKEGIENYFILTQLLPHKPLLIAESASRERRAVEAGQSKGDWIREMSEALRTDMSKIRLLAWFNEKETFRINSSREATKSFIDNILRVPHFRHGKAELEQLLR